MATAGLAAPAVPFGAICGRSVSSAPCPTAPFMAAILMYIVSPSFLPSTFSSCTLKGKGRGSSSSRRGTSSSPPTSP